MFINLSCSPNPISFGKIQSILDAEKWCWKSEFDKVVHEVWRWYHLMRKCLFPIHGLMANLHKKSYKVFIQYIACILIIRNLIMYLLTCVKKVLAMLVT